MSQVTQTPLSRSKGQRSKGHQSGLLTAAFTHGLAQAYCHIVSPRAQLVNCTVKVRNTQLI